MRRRRRSERGKQIDCLVDRSVIVILGGRMNVFDGCCRFRQGERLKTREIGLGPQEGNQCARGMYSKRCSRFVWGGGRFEGILKAEFVCKNVVSFQ